MPNVIVIRGLRDNYNDDFTAAAAITPGHLVEITSTPTVQKHGTAGGNATARLWALDRPELGKDIDTAYATSDRVKIYASQPGDYINALLKASENVAIGDKLESAGDGTLRKHVPQDVAASTADVRTNQCVAVALAASNTGSVVRLKVMSL